MVNTYQVQENEQLDDISKKFGIDKEEIINVNDFVSETLFPGQIINIPSKIDTEFDYYKVKDGDTLYSIASKNNVSIEMLSEINGLDSYEYLYPDQILIVPKKSTGLYITKMGETLRLVAENTNSTLEELIKDNASIYLLPDQLLVYKK